MGKHKKGQGSDGRDGRRVASIKFDDEAREKYLTTFHKRKQERRNRAKRELEELQRLVKIQSRKKKREEHDSAVRLWREQNGMADEDEGQDKEQGELSEPKTDTFETEDQLTTVTTVTDLDLDLDSRYGSAAEEDDDDDDDVGKDGGKKQDYEKKAKKLEHQLQRLNQPKRLKHGPRKVGGTPARRGGKAESGGARSGSRRGR